MNIRSILYKCSPSLSEVSPTPVSLPVGSSLYRHNEVTIRKKNKIQVLAIGIYIDINTGIYTLPGLQDYAPVSQGTFSQLYI